VKNIVMSFFSMFMFVSIFLSTSLSADVLQDGSVQLTEREYLLLPFQPGIGKTQFLQDGLEDAHFIYMAGFELSNQLQELEDSISRHTAEILVIDEAEKGVLTQIRPILLDSKSTILYTIGGDAENWVDFIRAVKDLDSTQ